MSEHPVPPRQESDLRDSRSQKKRIAPNKCNLNKLLSKSTPWDLPPETDESWVKSTRLNTQIRPICPSDHRAQADPTESESAIYLL